MKAAEIRERFLRYFERQQHVRRPSASLVPADDPTLLFVNAGMVPFKKIFLGQEQPAFGRRATTSQKCVRAGGKHNDLEQVGHTARHNTFFEMLGNFSFGDYFKRDAIGFAWEFITAELGMKPEHLRVSVHHSDDEARKLWREIAKLPDSRIYGLGDADNFWQMADTGPCGPCSEIFIDLALVTDDWHPPVGASGAWLDRSKTEFTTEEFIEGTEGGRFLEFWNNVFMQFDRQPDGTLVPLPKPSVDTGLGLERLSAIMQRQSNNYHSDLFAPLIASVERSIGIRYVAGAESDEFDLPVAAKMGANPAAQGGGARGHYSSFRVLADHARAVAFLLADGVFPSNEGRGYVLRRILRRAVRHAWLLGRREPTLVDVVKTVIETMSSQYPELTQRATHIVDTTRAEEERFLATIDGGMSRFEALAPLHTSQGGSDIRGTISGEDAFKLYDTYGFPIDLTELMARERGYLVDIPGFERALEAQRTQSKEERKAKKVELSSDELSDLERWERSSSSEDVRFVGYDSIEVDTDVAAIRRLAGDRVAVMLRETPFYAESGGQISDRGEIVGDGWRVDVDEVRKVEGRVAAVGKLTGALKMGPARARVPSDRRHDTERNHTATHLLHAALRSVLGEHVHQAGSLVAPDRLRFDFTNHGPVGPESLEQIEKLVNQWVWSGVDVGLREMRYTEAVSQGAMALFGEKYGDIVRVVSVPGFSVELCGGTHVRNTAQIGLFTIISETGVAAGVRRIEAATGRRAFEMLKEHGRALHRIAEQLRSPVELVDKRLQAVLEERKALEKRVKDAGRGGGDRISTLIASAQAIDGTRLVAAPVTATDVNELKTLGDALRDRLGSGVGVLGASLPDDKHTLLVVVTDDLRDKGVRADNIVRELAAIAGGKGGGKPHMAQAGIPDGSRLPAALEQAPAIVRPHVERSK